MAETFTFQTVTRYQAKLRLALQGVSGSGKTLGALYIAYGITGDWGKVALIDTEHERGRFYANREDLGTGVFLYSPLYPPYSPERYKAIVAAAANAVGSDGVVIVDSFSHAWNAEGGVLDIKEKISSRAGKNSYTAWAEAGKEQSSLVNTILAVPCHTIVTMRSKMEYALETDERGKQKPVKIGLAPVQRDDTEYEFDIVLEVDRSHIAVAQKDTTFLDKYGAVITPDLGKQLKLWLDSGENVSAKKIKEPTNGTTAEVKRETLDSNLVTREMYDELMQVSHMVLGKNNGDDYINAYLSEIGVARASQMTREQYITICDRLAQEVKNRPKVKQTEPEQTAAQEASTEPKKTEEEQTTILDSEEVLPWDANATDAEKFAML